MPNMPIYACDYCANTISTVEHDEGGLCLACREDPSDGDRRLIQHLITRFEYTNDNNRDLIQDTAFSIQDITEELEVQRAFQYLVAYLTRNPRT